jgi:hypothetical protein
MGLTIDDILICDGDDARRLVVTDLTEEDYILA